MQDLAAEDAQEARRTVVVLPHHRDAHHQLARRGAEVRLQEQADDDGAHHHAAARPHVRRRRRGDRPDGAARERQGRGRIDRLEREGDPGEEREDAAVEERRDDAAEPVREHRTGDRGLRVRAGRARRRRWQHALPRVPLTPPVGHESRLPPADPHGKGRSGSGVPLPGRVSRQIWAPGDECVGKRAGGSRGRARRQSVTTSLPASDQATMPPWRS
ncbi:hypothetical protein N866_12905 [Actinotalea ferrariae CF5-4]|uniref:Uncharacterized protein n=1 Tax=Actinotalea ferrariae CF5-4 TaxID=948458 RepID=A0A021VL94_9CELL|nr:hypothetical protein N866_12905 [Actinotalea ferrariae CF5-4]